MSLMNFIFEHLKEVGNVLELLILGGGIIASWTTMKNKLNTLNEKVDESKKAFCREFNRMEEGIDAELAAYRRDHEVCHETVRMHHENTMLHVTTQERELTRDWRSDLTRRLDRIESILSELKNHNTTNDNYKRRG